MDNNSMVWYYGGTFSRRKTFRKFLKFINIYTITTAASYFQNVGGGL